MSVGNLTNLVDKFKEYDVSSEKKIAVIEQATTPFQKVYTSSFEDFAQNWGINYLHHHLWWLSAK